MASCERARCSNISGVSSSHSSAHDGGEGTTEPLDRLAKDGVSPASSPMTPMVRHPAGKVGADSLSSLGEAPGPEKAEKTTAAAAREPNDTPTFAAARVPQRTTVDEAGTWELHHVVAEDGHAFTKVGTPYWFNPATQASRWDEPQTAEELMEEHRKRTRKLESLVGKGIKISECCRWVSLS